jgi:hypothetical protein
MDACRTKILTYVAGTASSSAACLFAMGDQGMRYAAPFSQLMFHEASFASSGKLSQIQTDNSHVQEVEELVNTTVEKHCKLKRGFFASLASRDLHIGAKQAKRLGIVSHIGTPRLCMTVDTSCALDGKPLPDSSHASHCRTVHEVPPLPDAAGSRQCHQCIPSESECEGKGLNDRRKRRRRRMK